MSKYLDFYLKFEGMKCASLRKELQKNRVPACFPVAALPVHDCVWGNTAMFGGATPRSGKVDKAARMTHSARRRALVMPQGANVVCFLTSRSTSLDVSK